MNSLFSVFRNMTISVKAMVSPVVILSLLLLLGVITFTNLVKINKEVTVITQDLALDAGTAAVISQQVYRKRLQVKDYIKTSSAKSIEKFNTADDKLQKILAKARNEIKHPDRVKLLNEVEELNQKYNDAFRNVVIVQQGRSQRLRQL